MEWISFSLDNEQKSQFENQLMPTLQKRYGSIIEMAHQNWAAYSQRSGLNIHRYLFCSDSPIINKYVKEFAGTTIRLFTTPDTANMEQFGPENLA